MGWLIAGGILLLLSILPLGFLVIYDSEGACVLLRVGFLRIPVYPAPSTEKKPFKQKKTRSKAAGFEKEKSIKKEGGKFTDFLPLLENIMELLASFRRKILVNELRLKLTLAGNDPADLAINYGRAWATLGNLMPRLEQFFRIRKRNLEVLCDFEGEQTLVDAKLHITITLGRLLWVSLSHGPRILKKFITITNKRKGGVQTHE